MNNDVVLSWLALALIWIVGFVIGYGACLMRKDYEDDMKNM